jgi:hypothetical protein
MSRSKQKLKRTQKRKVNKTLKKNVRKSMNRKVVKRYNKKTIKRGKNMHRGGMISIDRGIGHLKKSKDNKSMHAHLSDVLQSHIDSKNKSVNLGLRAARWQKTKDIAKSVVTKAATLALVVGARPFMSPIILTTAIITGSLSGIILGSIGFTGSIGVLFSKANEKDREKLLKDYIIKDMLEHDFLKEKFSNGVSLSDYVRENGTYRKGTEENPRTKETPRSKGYCLICTHVGRIKCEMKNWFEMAISENPISKSDLEQIEWYKPTTFKQKMYKGSTRKKKNDTGLKSYLSETQFSKYEDEERKRELKKFQKTRQGRQALSRPGRLGGVSYVYPNEKKGRAGLETELRRRQEEQEAERRRQEERHRQEEEENSAMAEAKFTPSFDPKVMGGGEGEHEFHPQIFGEGHSLTSEPIIFPLEDALKHYLFGTDFFNNCILLERILNKDEMYYISISLLYGGHLKQMKKGKERFARATENFLYSKIFPSSLIISEYGVLYGERIRKVIDLDRQVSADPDSGLEGAWEQIVKGTKGLVDIEKDEKEKIMNDIKSVKCAISEMIHIKDKFKGKLGDVPVITFCIPKSKMEKYKNQENLIVGDNEVAEVIQYRHGEAVHNLKLKEAYELSEQTGKKGGSSSNRIDEINKLNHKKKNKTRKLIHTKNNKKRNIKHSGGTISAENYQDYSRNISEHSKRYKYLKRFGAYTGTLALGTAAAMAGPAAIGVASTLGAVGAAGYGLSKVVNLKTGYIQDSSLTLNGIDSSINASEKLLDIINILENHEVLGASAKKCKRLVTSPLIRTIHTLLIALKKICEEQKLEYIKKLNIHREKHLLELPGDRVELLLPMGCNSRQILDDPLDQNNPCQIYRNVQSVRLTTVPKHDYKILYDCSDESLHSDELDFQVFPFGPDASHPLVFSINHIKDRNKVGIEAVIEMYHDIFNYVPDPAAAWEANLPSHPILPPPISAEQQKCGDKLPPCQLGFECQNQKRKRMFGFRKEGICEPIKKRTYGGGGSKRKLKKSKKRKTKNIRK